MINFKPSTPILESSDWILEYSTKSDGHHYIMYPKGAFNIYDYYYLITQDYYPILNMFEYLADFLMVDYITVDGKKFLAKSKIQ